MGYPQRIKCDLNKNQDLLALGTHLYYSISIFTLFFLQKGFNVVIGVQKDRQVWKRSQKINYGIIFVLYFSVCQSLKLQQFEKSESMQVKQQPKPLQAEELDNKYNTITYETRKTLIEMVSENGLSIYRAAKILDINHSTAKAILRKYRRFGHIFKRKHEDDKAHSDSYQNIIIGTIVDQQKKINQNTKMEQSKVADRSEAQNRDCNQTATPTTSGYYYYFPIVGLNWYQPNPYLI